MMGRVLLFILLFSSVMFAADVEVYDQYWTKGDTLTWTMKLFGQKWNEKRYSAGYDSLESALMDAAVDSVLPDTVTAVPGWVVMQPGKVDTFLNKTRIWASSNLRIEAPPGYVLDYVVDDSTGIYPELGFLISQNDSMLVFDGGHYKGNVSASTMNEYFHAFAFLNSKYIVMKDMRVTDWGGDALYLNNTKYFKAVNCQFECNTASLSPLVGRNGISVVSNAGDSLVSAQFVNCVLKGYGSPALVDIEPNTGGVIRDVLFDNCTFEGVGLGIGFEIYLGTSVYVENITLSNSIISNFNKGVWINCNSTSDSNHVNIILDNVTVSNCVTYGFYILTSNGIEIKNCVAHNCAQGFLINSNVIGLTMAGNRAFNNQDGFYFAGTSGNEIKNLSFNNNLAYNNSRYGLYAQEVQDSKFTNSSFFDNQPTPTQERGFYLNVCDEIYVDGCYERGNTVSNNLYTYNSTNIKTGSNYHFDNFDYSAGLRDPQVLLTDGSGALTVFADSISSSSGKMLLLNNQRTGATSNEIWSNFQEIKLWNYTASSYADIRANTLISTVGPGTAPLTVASTTLNTNLNADMLDGHHWSEIAAGSGSMTTVEEGDTQRGGADIVTLDFATADFSVSESPDTEINISIRDTGIDHDATANFLADEHIDWTDATDEFDTEGYFASGAPFYLKDSSGTNRAIINYIETTNDYFVYGNSGFRTVIKGGNATDAIDIDNGIANINQLTLDNKLDFSSYVNATAGTGIAFSGDQIQLGALTSNHDFGGYEVKSATFESDVATGTAPFTVASTTKVNNLDADYLDGESASAFVEVDGSDALTGDWDAGAFDIRASKFTARLGAGLYLVDYYDRGLYIANGGKIMHALSGLGSPQFSFETRVTNATTYNGISMGCYYDATHYIGMYQGSSGDPSFLIDDGQKYRFGFQSSMGSGYNEAATLNYDGDFVTDGHVGHTAQQTVTLGSGATTFAVTTNVVRVTGDAGGNTVSTITGAEVGMYTFIFTDNNVTISNNDAHTADTVDYLGATNFLSADDKTLLLTFDGTSWYRIGESSN